MKILGIGVDIVENIRIHKSIKNISFIKKVFSSSEILLAKKITNKKSYYSKRFAAKEAFSKALGTGIGKEVGFQDLTVRNNENGKPHFITSEKLRLYLLAKGIKQAHLSISDESKNAVAFVVLETDNKG